jgi:hypothetical protein
MKPLNVFLTHAHGGRGSSLALRAAVARGNDARQAGGAMQHDCYLWSALNRVILLLVLVMPLGCMAPHVSMSECEMMCARQGQKVQVYHVGSVVPIFKPRPPVICECGG